MENSSRAALSLCRADGTRALSFPILDPSQQFDSAISLDKIACGCGDKLECIMRATYEGDTAYQAIVDRAGNLHITDDSDKVVSIRAARARKIVAELNAVADYGYGDIEINAARHWILARDFMAA
jgi:hypothetical protein